jgi:hypothetical protein
MTSEARFTFTPEGAPERPAGTKGGNLILRYAMTEQIARQIAGLDFTRVVLGHGSWPDLSALRGKPIRSMLIRGGDLDWTTINSMEHLNTLELETPEKVELDSALLNRLLYLALTWDKHAQNGLKESSSLKALNVYGGIPSLKALAGLNKLEALMVIKSTKLVSLDGIEELSLSYAEFVQCGKLAALADLARCDRLFSLNLEACKGLHDVAALATAPNLREVLVQTGEVSTLSHLASSSIEKLRFDCHIADGNLDFLFQMPRLKYCLFKDAKQQNHCLSDVQRFLEGKGFTQKPLRDSLKRFPAPQEFV